MATSPPPGEVRNVVFLSKATPSDDEFALWLAPRLEAAGYTVFADILTLEPGDRWRREITETLQNRSIKMLLCCRDSTIAKEGVQEEIGIALDLCKSLGDKKFLIPLRLEPYKKLFGIGEIQYTDFVRGWGQGLAKLLDALKRQKVPRKLSDPPVINPNWENYRRRGAVQLLRQSERLTSNWLRIAECPEVIRYYEPVGAIDRARLLSATAKTPFPVHPAHAGVLTFADPHDLDDALSGIGRFSMKAELRLMAFVADGCSDLNIARQDASNLVHSMFRQAWIAFCRSRGLLEYGYSSAQGFHAGATQVKIGQRVNWGVQGERRWSMLRNVARGHVWHYGVSAMPAFWPFPHFKLKSRVLFALHAGEDAGPPLDEPRKQHRLRRTVCKGWRNKQWHGRMRAYLELLSGESAFLRLPLAPGADILVEASPLLFTSAVSTVLPNELTDDQEEQDDSTLGKPDPEDDAT